MIELTFMEMANPYFQTALNSIWDCPMLDGQTSYTAHRIKVAIDKASKDVSTLRRELIEKYGQKDESGNLINDPHGRITFENAEHEKAFETEFTKEFNSRKICLKVTKLQYDTLRGVHGITPRTWEFLAPIVDNLPTEAEEPTPSHHQESL